MFPEPVPVRTDCSDPLLLLRLPLERLPLLLPPLPPAVVIVVAVLLGIAGTVGSCSSVSQHRDLRECDRQPSITGSRGFNSVSSHALLSPINTHTHPRNTNLVFILFFCLSFSKFTFSDNLTFFSAITKTSVLVSIIPVPFFTVCAKFYRFLSIL